MSSPIVKEINMNLIITGLARSGKDTIADYLVEKYGFVKYTFSSVLEEILEKQGIVPNKERMNSLGDELRKEAGMDAVAQFLGKKIIEEDKVVLVGPRSVEEMIYFLDRFPDIKVIKVTSKNETRFSRRTEIDSSDEKKFFQRDEEDIKNKGLGEVLENFDFEIKNNGSKELLETQLDVLVDKLKQ